MIQCDDGNEIVFANCLNLVFCIRQWPPSQSSHHLARGMPFPNSAPLSRNALPAQKLDSRFGCQPPIRLLVIGDGADAPDPCQKRAEAPLQTKGLTPLRTARSW